MSPAHPFDASIPVLTEVLHDLPPAPALEAPAGQDSDSDLEALERRLSERILQQLQARVDFVLEQRIRDSMEEVLSHALRGFTAEIRHGLHDTLAKIVSRAVTQELAHLHAQKK